MKFIKKQFTLVLLSLSLSLSSCSGCSDPRIAYLAIDIAISVGDMVIDSVKDGTFFKTVEDLFDYLFLGLTNEKTGAIIVNPNDPFGLTGMKALDAKYVVKHRENDLKTETITIKKEDLTFERASRDSLAKWEMTEATKNLIETRLNAAAIQISLKSFDIDPGSVDGNWGKRSKQALKEFQKLKGLDQTGEADEKTLSLLLSKN